MTAHILTIDPPSGAFTDGRHPAAKLAPAVVATLAKALLLALFGVQLLIPSLKHHQHAGDILWCCKNVQPPPTQERSVYEQSTTSLDRRCDQFVWAIAMLLALWQVYFLEHRWVLQALMPWRDEGEEPPPPRQDGSCDDGASNKSSWSPTDGQYVAQMRALAAQTLPYLLYQLWLPVVTVHVNLGFEKLKYRRVIQTMLTELRAQYHETFFAPTSRLALVGWVLLGFLALVLLVPVVDAAFGSEALGCAALRVNRNDAAPLSQLACAVGGDAVLSFLRQSLYSGGLVGNRLWFVPVPGLEASLVGHLRVQHLLVFPILAVLLRWGLQRTPFLPYRRNLRRLDQVIEALAKRQSTTSEHLQAGQRHNLFWPKRRVRQTWQEPLDARTAEFAAIQALGRLRDMTFRLKGSETHRLSLPSPEITFVFDELDKLATANPQEPAGPKAGVFDQGVEAEAQRNRSVELRRLLADLKNLLSTGPARFVFVGGRDLHDEWLADQAERQPLLASVFIAELYLPSLLVDTSAGKKSRWHGTTIEAFLERRRDASQRAYEAYEAQRSGSMPLPARRAETFSPSHSNPPPLAPLDLWQTGPSTTKRDADAAFPRDLVDYLAYASLGNPRKAQEHLERFLVPASRLPDPLGKAGSLKAHDALLFGDDERRRVQLLSRMYRHIRGSLDGKIASRDDKAIVSALYLWRFLLKFHRRAFAWSNLEHLEDLLHTHRPPETRNVLEDLLNASVGRYLQRIRNGMYNFRFRGGMAAELAFMSRRSPEDMAAFNFTLDESQRLKADYQRSIEKRRSSGGPELAEMIWDLGELHEFDQDYEMARLHYQEGLGLLDKAQARNLAPATTRPTERAGTHEQKDPDTSVIWPPPGDVEQWHPWAVTRLRLMLQIGMTFELSRNMERASVEYLRSATFARKVIERVQRQPKYKKGHTHVRPLQKHVNLLYQPFLAAAWAGTKFPSGVDSALAYLENELIRLRRLITGRQTVATADRDRQRGASSGLIMAALHHKAADLYFWRGTQVSRLQTPLAATCLLAPTLAAPAHAQHSPRRRREGYLLKAYYHHAVGLHEIRRFNAQRRKMSEGLFNVRGPRKDGAQEGTFEDRVWPEFVERSAAGAMASLSETTLGRVSLVGVFRDLRRPEDDSDKQKWPLPGPERLRQVVSGYAAWINGEKVGGAYDLLPAGSGKDVPVGRLETWLGRDVREGAGPAAGSRLLEFGDETGHDDLARLLVAARYGTVAARYLEEAGYVEDAVQELVNVCEMTTTYLWWGLAIDRICGWSADGGGTLRPRLGNPLGDVSVRSCQVVPGGESRKWAAGYARLFAALGIEALEHLAVLAKTALDGSADATNGSEDNERRPKERPPARAKPIAASFLLALEAWNAAGAERAPCKKEKEEEGDVGERIKTILAKWCGAEVLEMSSRDMLINSVCWDAYPTHGRLCGLKALIDSAVLTKETRDSEEMAKRWLADFEELAASYDAPLQFSPGNVGWTLAVLALRLRYEKDYAKSCGIDDGEWRALAARGLKSLRQSEELVTLGRTFYETISDKYFLYDDFNDRRAHFNQAMQMAGAEYTAFLRALLEEELTPPTVAVCVGPADGGRAGDDPMEALRELGFVGRPVGDRYCGWIKRDRASEMRDIVDSGPHVARYPSRVVTDGTVSVGCGHTVCEFLASMSGTKREWFGWACLTAIDELWASEETQALDVSVYLPVVIRYGLKSLARALEGWLRGTRQDGRAGELTGWLAVDFLEDFRRECGATAVDLHPAAAAAGSAAVYPVHVVVGSAKLPAMDCHRACGPSGGGRNVAGEWFGWACSKLLKKLRAMGSVEVGAYLPVSVTVRPSLAAEARQALQKELDAVLKNRTGSVADAIVKGWLKAGSIDAIRRLAGVVAVEVTIPERRRRPVPVCAARVFAEKAASVTCGHGKLCTPVKLGANEEWFGWVCSEQLKKLRSTPGVKTVEVGTHVQVKVNLAALEKKLLEEVDTRLKARTVGDGKKEDPSPGTGVLKRWVHMASIEEIKGLPGVASVDVDFPPDARSAPPQPRGPWG